MENIIVVYFSKTFKIFVVLTVIVFFTRSFIIEPGKINGRSMEDTFFDKELFFVNKASLLFKSPKREQIVQFINPETNEFNVKRIIGLPGETIIIKHNKIYIKESDNEEVSLIENYISSQTLSAGFDDLNIKLNKNEYFLLGDNRQRSIDSRNLGPIHRKYILGLVF